MDAKLSQAATYLPVLGAVSNARARLHSDQTMIRSQSARCHGNLPLYRHPPQRAVDMERVGVLVREQLRRRGKHETCQTSDRLVTQID